VEHLDRPLDIGDREPRLSWRLPADVRRQLAYRLRTADGDSGWVNSAASVLVPWPFAPLGARQRSEVRVPVRTDRGEERLVRTRRAPGSNAITVLLSDGWYRGHVGLLRSADHTAFLAQPHVDHGGGTTVAGGRGRPDRGPGRGPTGWTAGGPGGPTHDEGPMAGFAGQRAAVTGHCRDGRPAPCSRR
jgi:hypothetical protein